MCLVIGCQGSISVYDSQAGDGEGKQSSPQSGTGSDEVISPESDEPPEALMGEYAQAGPSRLWRLTHDQYEAVVSVLLGIDDLSTQGFEPESSGTGFRGGADASFVSAPLAEDYAEKAALLAERAVQDVENLLGCSADERGCASNFVESFGAQAFRAPLSSELRDRYLSLYDQFPGKEGIQLIVEAMLQSPHFLYRFELGENGVWGERVPLTPYEMATQLSFLIWNAPPDTQLHNAASQGLLATEEGIVNEVSRMLDDPRATDLYWNFLKQYLGIELVTTVEKDESVTADFGPELKAAFVDEARTFTNHVAWDSTSSVGELLSADYSFINEPLANFYGKDGISGSRFQRVEFAPEQRVGLLTHPGVVAVLGHQDSGSPTLRGKFIRTRLLCGQVPEPPPDVDDTVKEPGEAVTTRQRYEEHLTRDDCRGCHRLIDPIGFGLENFDAAGQYRTEESGQPIDATGNIAGIAGGDVTFEGPRALVEALLASEELKPCFVRHFFRFAMGRLEENYDTCELEQIVSKFEATGGDLTALLMALIESKTFSHRVKL